MRPAFALGIALLLLSACRDRAEPEKVQAPAAQVETPAPKAAEKASAPETIPADVTAFIAKRDQCDHLRGEDAYDEERGHFLAEQLDKFCTGTDAVLAKLRKQHAANKAAIAALSEYEDKVE